MLIFDEGDRPSSREIERALSGSVVPGAGALARVSHCSDPAEGWVELLASGLTFDLSGLMPAASVARPDRRQVLGLPADAMPGGSEAVALVPGPHVSAGAALLPVVRVLCGLAAGLVRALPVRAVCWRPASTWMAPAYFDRIVEDWLGGGAFPSLGLTSLEVEPGGGVVSGGLAFFTGQELRVEAGSGAVPAETVKFAVRLIDRLVEEGPVRETTRFEGHDGATIEVRPDPAGRLITARRIP